MSKFSLNHKYNCAGIGGIGRISIPCNICSTFRGQDGIEYAAIEREAFEGSLSLFMVLRSDVSCSANDNQQEKLSDSSASCEESK